MGHHALSGIPVPVWQDRAGCIGADPDLFHPVTAEDPAVAEAKAICAWCPVRTDCLGYATAHFLQGIWGGTTEDERRLERRRQLRAVRKQAAA
jgi:WhiB family transcriptional regulator, redox-sensing transcriptional regulator